MLRSSALLVTLLLAGSAAAQTVPFAIAGVGNAPEGLPLPGQPARLHNIVGVAPFLGLHTGLGEVQTDTVVPADVGEFGGFTGEFKGKFTFRKLNGSKLVTDYGNTAAGASTPGTFTITIVGATLDGAPIVEALFIAEFVVDPAKSTSQFKGATGRWVMYAQTAPFVLGSTDSTDYGWVGAGTLTFPK